MQASKACYGSSLTEEEKPGVRRLLGEFDTGASVLLRIESALSAGMMSNVHLKVESCDRLGWVDSRTVKDGLLMAVVVGKAEEKIVLSPCGLFKDAPWEVDEDWLSGNSLT